MSLNFLRNIVFIIVLLLAQTLLLNHISVFGCATPLLYVYFALTVQRGEAKWATLLWCFFMGLLVDIFTNTPGVAAASMTLVGFLQPYVVELFAPRDSADDLRPSPFTFGSSKYTNYTIFLVLIYCFTFFSLEAFNLYNWGQWIACIVASTIITVVLILVIEYFRSKR